MDKSGLMQPKRRDAAPDAPAYGDTWQGEALNRLVPALERAGFSVIPGTLDISGLSVLTPTGDRTRLGLVTPTTVRAYAEEVGPGDAPSDQWPHVVLGGGATLGVFRGE